MYLLKGIILKYV